MPGDFHSQRFSIKQDKCAMKVSTDGILLGSWADVLSARNILDIGTGTGLLSLMCAQRNPSARITGVELDSDACDQAKENAAASPWKERIVFRQVDIREYHDDGGYDAIICNPPYYSGDLSSPDPDVNLAKHGDRISLDELLRKTGELLSMDGRAHFIFPMRRKEEMLVRAASFGLFPLRLCTVHYEEERPPIRFLLTLSRTEGEVHNELITVQHPDNSYTAEYRELAGEFLLKTGSD